jgi:acyl-coenzyme A synthetase/AMP-(fatty) acid ligase
MSEERILAALPEIQDCTVIIVQENGQFLTDVLLEVPADADPIKDRDERILAAVGEEVASTIRRIHVVGEDEVPVTVTGKVRKVALRTERLKPNPPSTAEGNGASPETPFAGDTSGGVLEGAVAGDASGAGVRR